MRQCSDLVHWEDLEGPGGEGGGRGDRDGEHMWTHGCFISMYDKIHYNKKKNKENKQTKKENVDFPLFCRFPCKINLKKWPCYIRNSSSVYQRETNKWRTFEVYWPYRLVSHMSWIHWRLKLRFEEVSVFQKQVLNLWRRRGWYKHTDYYVAR